MKIIRTLSFLFFIWFLESFFYFTGYCNNGNINELDQRKQDHLKTIVKVDEQWNLLNQALRFEEQKKFQEAKVIYEKLSEEWVTSSVQGMAESGLINVYENVGMYHEALALVNKMLAVNRIPETVKKYQDVKQRLLRKIEEQKKGKDNVVEQIKQEFPKATHEEQKQFLESLSGEGVWDVFQKAMVAEHSGDYKEALALYESLLPRKEDIIRDMKSVDGWVMLYPAIQRTSELSGDHAKEKEALLWIRNNLLNPEGEHHASLSKLEPAVISHIRSRVKALLQSNET